MDITCLAQKKWSWACLVLGAVLMYFANWNWSVPASAWLFAVFLLRFSRSSTVRMGMASLSAVCLAVGTHSLWRLLAIEPIPPAFRLAAGLATAVFLLLPFLVDRLLVGRLPGAVATLVFPASWAALEYLKALGNGSWGALAYSQYGNLLLMQLVSVTGIWGLSFVIAWLASVVNFVWEREFVWPRIRRVVVLYAVVVGIVFVYGSIRLAVGDESGNKVSVATVINPRDFVARFYGPDWKDRKAGGAEMKRDLDFLFAATRNAAAAGAKIVLWQEYGVVVPEEREQELLQLAQQLAQEEQIYLGMAMGLFPLRYPEQPWQNKLVWIDPEGRVVDQYFKQKPAPPLEPIVAGTGGIHLLSTTDGKIASAICADLDYPGLIRQAGANGAGILMIPAQSWSAVDPLHTEMAVFRAIENGCSLIMATGGGLSIAVDPYGRIIAGSGSSQASKEPMLASVPNKGVETVYASFGDVFAWLCVAGLVVMIVWGYWAAKKEQG